MASTFTTTRSQLINAGSLLDVSRLGRGHHMKLPCAISAAAWVACGGLRDDCATATGDELANRILAAARSQAVHSPEDALARPVLGFALEDTRLGGQHIIELELVVGPGDDGDPVATINVAGF